MSEPCRHAIDRFTSGLDGRPGASDVAFLESHLEGCAGCREEAERVAALHRDLTRLAVDPDQDRVTALLAKVRWEEAGLSRRRRRRLVPPPAERRGFVAAVVAVAFLAGILAALLSTGRRAPQETPLATPEPPPAPAEAVRHHDPTAPPRVVKETRRAPEPETPARRPSLEEPPAVAAPAPRDLESTPPKPVPDRASHASGGVPAATLEAASGATSLDGNPVGAGTVLGAGQTLSTAGGALLALPDATRVYLGADSAVRFTAGKTLYLLEGDLAADVTPQPKEDPCVFATELADVRVLGTWLAVSSRPGSTRVEVEKGRVQVRRRRDGWTLDVREGNGATVSEGQAPRVRPLPANLLGDPGFDPDGKAWTGLYHPDGQNYGGISVQSKVARSGTKSLEFVASRVTGCDREVFQTFTVAPGDAVAAEGWLKTDKVGPRGVGAWLLWLRAPDADFTALLRAKGSVLREDLVGSVAGTADWTRVARRLTAPPQSRLVRFVLYADVELTGAGRAWFDDLRLRRFTK